MRVSKESVSLVIIAAVFAALVFVAPDVLLVVFAGVLVAVFLRYGGHWIAERAGLAYQAGLAIFLVGLLLMLVGATVAFAPAVMDQANELFSQIPAAAESLRHWIGSYSWGDALLERATPQGLWSAGGGSAATMAVTSTFGALGNFVIILFIGLYGAIGPDIYRKGFLALMAPSLRPRGEKVLDKATATLADWLAAKLMSMAIVGVLTAVGLWLIGVPLAFLLGLIAALLAFIPNIGPVIAAVPAILLAFPQGTNSVLMVAAVYIVVQTLESYVVTPIIQQEKVSLPPALVIGMQLLFGVLFGLPGLALATPLTALGKTLVREIYVDGYLEDESKESGRSTKKKS
jgi:predicted PurR-regulated permease PerM